jgi:hypothetical protein
MHAPAHHELSLPLDAVTNAAFPYERQVAEARRYLAARGITQPRSLYGASRPRAALQAALASRFETQRAANDAVRREPSGTAA